ncbi:E3 SUMO-protein ligase ZBED1-like [Anastrepha ludens]|uniref:E3 SUMO-protein ligase ZBED1-like n=1 Tax=Anastrepha ludens TaxID=28586 RepID=UPI0023B03CE6|nr:E3 SUMO-protein ligase ZBED1-like [Anastrepha ludens]
MDKFLLKNSQDGQDSSIEAIEEDNQLAKRQRVGRSSVWGHFEKINNGMSAKCRSCGKMYKTSGNTSNLFDHLKRAHPGQRVNDLSITSVEDPEFRDFIKLFDPRYKLPSRTTLSNVMMTNLFDEQKPKLKNLLSKINHCAITTDMWTSLANESYMTDTCSFITDSYCLRSAVLSTNKLIDETNHTAKNIADTLQAVCNEWGIFDKITAIVTDNASSMIKACELLKKRNLPCYAHSLNLVVQDCLKLDCTKELLKKCNSIVAFFKNSTIAYKKFKDSQLTETKYSLIQEVATRWNSAFLMIERVLKTHEPINITLLSLSKAPQPLTADEINILKGLSQILSPFDIASKEVSSNSKVTVSLVIPVTCGLLNNLENSTKNLLTEVGLKVNEFLIDCVIKKLYKYEDRTVTSISTLLDPRFKKQGFRSQYNAKNAEKLLIEELIHLSKSSALTSEPPTPIDQPKPTRHPLYEFVKINIENLPRTKRSDAIIDLQQYIGKHHSLGDVDPLKYWQNNESSIKDLTTKYFCIPASSTESERLFSKAGQIITERRAALKAKHEGSHYVKHMKHMKCLLKC